MQRKASHDNTAPNSLFILLKAIPNNGIGLYRIYRLRLNGFSVWMPINYLIIQSVRKYGQFYGNALKVECPTGSGDFINLEDVADFLTRRVISLFQPDETGAIPQYGQYNWFYQQPGNEHLNLFYEYFHGDNGQGLGACQQTGWTALLAELISEQQRRSKEKTPVETPEITVVT